MSKGYLNLVLHAHLPFVRHVDRDDRLEERWLFEAMTECYIPLLQVFQQLVRDKVDFRVTISLSPTLLSMLRDALLQDRYKEHLDKSLRLAELEVERTRGDAKFHALARAYRQKLRDIQQFYDDYHGDLVSAFRDLHATGCIELMTSAATHAFLPYIQTEAAIRAQIATAVTTFESCFGFRPPGIWLPECAYTPRVLAYLQEYSIRYFFVDTHAFTSAEPRPAFGTFSPVLVGNSGIAAFARDEECSRQVWSSEHGYPGDYEYREYYRDIGFDLDEAYIQPFIHPDGIRVNTGFKYYRITGRGVDKEPYDLARAREKACEHAGNFMFNRQQQLAYMHGQMGRLPVVTAPYDAELFGHWWYEGPIFLDVLLRKLHFDQSEIRTITPSEYLALYPDYPCVDLGFSSWGRNGYGEVWLNGTNDWMYPALHECERRLTRSANRSEQESPLVQRALNQAARELMLAQSSDWSFIMDQRTSVNYAVSRFKQHINRCLALLDMVEAKHVDMDFLQQVESIDNLFPEIDYRLYQSSSHIGVQAIEKNHPTDPPRSILMLSWEFPPISVGGLSRHVYDLARAMAAQGVDVHVITLGGGDSPLEDTVDGVHVHRVSVRQPDGRSFIDFAFQMNLAMLDRALELAENGLVVDVIHAHDWLVADAAKTLKQRWRLPLIATIHATEHGRNHGIYTDTQAYIHHREWVLTYEAARVIVCSSYMQSEVQRLFALPSDKVRLLPNGIQVSLPAAGWMPGVHEEKDGKSATVVFVGRLVREKGVQHLLDAAPAILRAFPNTRFVIVGQGPMLSELEQQCHKLGIDPYVEFAGYVDDEYRNDLLQTASAVVVPSLYEPFGIVALEAMAAGTPLVASDVGGLSDIVDHDRNGLKVYPGDAQSIAQQVCRLLGDPALRRRLRETASADLARFDWQSIAKATQQIYEEVATKRERQAIGVE
ncbi:1,4-alpha-glucan branching enzyme [Alicyclobacillus hesperidum]|uniref:1,4-alpha-glucan branching enzyme n=1 Tax=Alicyclobacillus hesperidum TaxID=89784 RepID=A0A1H2W1K5_9BACL|nr:1,4-alpha-glucan branching protein domain-containing protein [Alicyclobacillus hesperidum]SDW74357.1 1,4-alpha-glucan branching enzyme [Alicyclobacillus hesperidum]